MRVILLTIVFWASYICISFGQGAFAELEKLYNANAVLSDKSISYVVPTNVLYVSGYRIRATAATLVKAETHKKEVHKHTVAFYCQNGTYIVNMDNPNARHAQISIPLKTGKACKTFAKLFTQLSGS